MHFVYIRGTMYLENVYFLVAVSFGYMYIKEGYDQIMLREQRSRTKLEGYYRQFRQSGIIDHNVHPWVAESWKKSEAMKIPAGKIETQRVMAANEFAGLQTKHKSAIDFLGRMSENIREFLQHHSLSLLLLDSTCLVLKSYAQPFYQLTDREIEGCRIGMEEVGTSSVSIACEHRAPFWMFGPEMWVEECQQGDACSAPIIIDDELCYIITLVAVRKAQVDQDAVIALLLTMKQSLEQFLKQDARLRAQEAILDATPLAVYHVLPNGDLAYANKLGLSRLKGIGAEKTAIDTGKPFLNLNDYIMNYRHTPLHKGFEGVPSYNKAVTWITQNRTYEDITTVVPLKKDFDSEVNSVVAVSMPIEDLRMLVAHAAGFTAKYSLGSLVTDGDTFGCIRERAFRLARTRNHILLQGEAGTGKQRMAHGIHQASPRAVGPFITLRCGDNTPEIMEQELFGVTFGTDVSHQGKLELAHGGTLFMDEIEKLPKELAAKLAKALHTGITRRVGEQLERSIDVRIVAACDSDLRRLTERGLFDKDLFSIIAKSIIRVPGLRSRKEDIPSLADNIIKELAVLHQMSVKSLAPETVQKLMDYDWPGNIKQLQGVIEYAFFNTEGDVIPPENISLLGDVKPDTSWKEDRAVFLRAWQAAGGNVSRMANLLNVSRVTLYRYLKKYGLEKN